MNIENILKVFIEMLPILGIGAGGGGLATWIYKRRKEKRELRRLDLEDEGQKYSGYKSAVDDLNESYNKLRSQWVEAQDSLVILEVEISKLKILYETQKLHMQQMKEELDECRKHKS